MYLFFLFPFSFVLLLVPVLGCFLIEFKLVTLNSLMYKYRLLARYGYVMHPDSAIVPIGPPKVYMRHNSIYVGR